MSEDSEGYCRLCAELTPPGDMISTSDVVGQNSKISTKMLWINVDVSDGNLLPKTICFSCFDALERAWKFLQNVRAAQEKLSTIFKVETTQESGKPISKIKSEVKSPVQEILISDPKSILKEAMTVKSEITVVEHENYSDNNFSSDSEEPLHKLAVKKATKSKKKKKLKYDSEILEDELTNNVAVEVLDMSIYTMTWDDYTWCCGKCDAQCKSLDMLQLHSLDIHQSCCAFKCLDCEKIFQFYHKFIKHVQSHYKALCYHCDICNEYLNQPELLKKHRKTHKVNKESLCKWCGKQFDSFELWKSHSMKYLPVTETKKEKTRKREVIDKKLKCDVCNKEFKSRSNLVSHKLVHTERTKDFACHICGKMFFTKGSLGTHILIHEDVKPFKCDYCSISFRVRGNLVSHLTMHSGAKPFVCEQCGKSFRAKRHLKSHSIVHTDLMPYVCGYCNKSFRFKTRLNLHVRQHTGAKPYSCDHCKRDFTNGSNYKKHMQRAHNIDVRKRVKLVVVDQNHDNSTDTPVVKSENGMIVA